uniref:hypothetical protein n=1 Tax=Algoriphagus sp. TaxID=1872435 RepID=UPI0040487E4B
MSVLIHVGTITFFNSLFEIALLLKKRNITCVFFFDNFYPNYLKDCNTLRENDFKYVIYFDENNYNNDGSFFVKFSKYLLYLNRRILGERIIKFFQEFKNVFQKKRFFDNLLVSNNFSYLIMSSDLVQYDTGLFIRIAKKRNVKSVVFPQFFANYKESVEHIYSNSENQISTKFFFIYSNIIFLIKWSKLYKQKYLLRLPLYKVLVKEIFGIAPVNPWTINSGGADLIVVEGSAVKSFFMNEKCFSDNKVVVAGSVNNDKLFESLLNYSSNKENLVREFNFCSSKPVALVAIPPNMFDSRILFTEFETYQNLIDFWMAEINKLTSFNILISLHPAISKEEFCFIKGYGYPILDKSIVDYIPLVDLFIASISATIQWAIACGIPVLNYDSYDYQYDEYRDVEGVLYVNNKINFKKLIEYFNDLNNLEIIRVLQKKHSQQWGVLDGCFSNRLIDLIKE